MPKVSTKKYRRNSSRNAIREIKKAQNSTRLLIPKSCFQRLVRGLSKDHKSALRFQGDALESLQSACEEYLIKQFAVANKICIHGKRQTVQQGDLKLAADITSPHMDHEKELARQEARAKIWQEIQDGEDDEDIEDDIEDDDDEDVDENDQSETTPVLSTQQFPDDSDEESGSSDEE